MANDCKRVSQRRRLSQQRRWRRRPNCRRHKESSNDNITNRNAADLGSHHAVGTTLRRNPRFSKFLESRELFRWPHLQACYAPRFAFSFFLFTLFCNIFPSDWSSFFQFKIHWSTPEYIPSFFTRMRLRISGLLEVTGYSTSWILDFTYCLCVDSCNSLYFFYPKFAAIAELIDNAVDEVSFNPTYF